MARARNKSADKTYYSWSNIRVPDPKKPGEWTVVKPGEEVTAGMFDSEDELENLVQVGSVRTMECPETRIDESPRVAMLAEIRRMQEALEEGYQAESESVMDVDEVDDVDEDDEDDTATS